MIIFGFDAGLSSIGWSVIDARKGTILDCGCWMFEAPEDPKERTPKSAERRDYASARRTKRRRVQRMDAVRRLLSDLKLIDHAGKNALHFPSLNPWILRRDGLHRQLERHELAAVLGHIARHRGVLNEHAQTKSSRKNEDKETGKILKALKANTGIKSRYPTVAQMMVEDDQFIIREYQRNDGTTEQVRRYRNKAGDYTRSLSRHDIREEANKILNRQLNFPKPLIREADKDFYLDIAFHQRPLQAVLKMVGSCSFEPDEYRCARYAPSYERFRFLTRLHTMRLEENGVVRKLTVQEVVRLNDHFGETQDFKYSKIRKILDLSPLVKFANVKKDDESKYDCVMRSGQSARATSILGKMISTHLGKIRWQNLKGAMRPLDDALFILSFETQDRDHLFQKMRNADIPEDLTYILLDAWDDGVFADMSGTGHLSAKVVRAMIPHLLAGKDYSQSAEVCGYDHTMSSLKQALATGHMGKQALKQILSESRIDPSVIPSATARKATIELLKQVKDLIERFGVPDRIHFEMARDLGKSAEQRDKITEGMEKKRKDREKLAESYSKEIGEALPADGWARRAQLLKYQLLLEQNCKSLYSDAYISPADISLGANKVQIDHILPWGRFGDNSYHNLTLCLIDENQAKGNRTPYEWIYEEQGLEAWRGFGKRVETCNGLKGMKKRNLLLTDSKEREEGFRNRNLNDTRLANKVALEALRQVLPDELHEKTGQYRRRVFARPGQLTALIRKAWGLDRFKFEKDGKKRIADDRHHALDAILVAYCSEGFLQKVTRLHQELSVERRDFQKPEDAIRPYLPRSDFADYVKGALDSIHVARSETRRQRGALHKETTYQIRNRDDEDVLYKRISVTDKKFEKYIDKIKDPERNAALIESLRKWIDGGKKGDPLSSRGDVIRKVRVEITDKPAILRPNDSQKAPFSSVAQSDMVRVDVFKKAKKNGTHSFHMVPIYRNDYQAHKAIPNRAISRAKGGWPEMTQDYEFLFSLYRNSFVRLEQRAKDKDSVSVEGYFRSLHGSDGGMHLSSHLSTTICAVTHKPGRIKKNGTGQLTAIRKFTVDRAGRRHEIKKEPRLWPGKSST